MLTLNKRQRALWSAWGISAAALAIAFTNPEFRAAVEKEIVWMSELRTLQAHAKLAAFERAIAVVHPVSTNTD